MASSADITIRNIRYSLGLTADDEALRVDLQETDSGELWSGTFNARYVEEITQKTGSFKKFGVFVSMLRSALGAAGVDESLKLDILTYADLELLKQRRAAGIEGSGSVFTGPNPASSSKRYLILTYSSQFDRVHFPLPLAHLSPARGAHAEPPPVKLSEPQPARCGLSVANARVQWLGVAPASAVAPQPVGVGATGAQQSLQARCVQLAREKDEVVAAYENLRRESSRESERLRRRCAALESELGEQSEQALALEAQLLSQRGEEEGVAKLRSKLARLEEVRRREREELERALDKHKKELLLVNAELARSRREEERLRSHLRQADAEAKVAHRRSAASGHARGGDLRAARPSASAGSRSISRAPSAERYREPYPRPTSRPASRGSSAQGSSAASSRSSSRASSVERARTERPPWNAGPATRAAPAEHVAPRGASASASARASRAPSAAGSRAPSRPASAPHSRVVSRVASRPGSDTGEGSPGASSLASSHSCSRASSRASSAERSRPRPARASRARGVADASGRGASHPASIEHAAREALAHSVRSARRPAAPPPRRRPGPLYSSEEEAEGPAWGARPAAVGALATRKGRDVDALKENQLPRAAAAADQIGFRGGGLREYGGPSLNAPSQWGPSQGGPSQGGAPAAAEVQGSLGGGPRPATHPADHDTLRDISDIDRRLNALQDFLKEAKVR